ncbi:hypothetical protein PMIN04_008858 [Paraphaeosphaeria minitans]
MAGLTSFVYNTVFRSNVTMLTTVFASAFAMQLAFDTGSDRIWDSINRGVPAMEGRQGPIRTEGRGR